MTAYTSEALPPMLALDPGGTTGYTLCLENKISGGQLGPDKHHVELWELLYRLPDNVHVIYERFDNDGNPAALLISEQYIGVVELFCQLYSVPLFPQPRHILTLAWTSDEALKKYKLYTPGKPHKNDAMRHMIYHIVQTLGYKGILRKLRD